MPRQERDRDRIASALKAKRRAAENIYLHFGVVGVIHRRASLGSRFAPRGCAHGRLGDSDDRADADDDLVARRIKANGVLLPGVRAELDRVQLQRARFVRVERCVNRRRDPAGDSLRIRLRPWINRVVGLF